MDQVRSCQQTTLSRNLAYKRWNIVGKVKVHLDDLMTSHVPPPARQFLSVRASPTANRKLDHQLDVFFMCTDQPESAARVTWTLLSCIPTNQSLQRESSCRLYCSIIQSSLLYSPIQNNSLFLAVIVSSFATGIGLMSLLSPPTCWILTSSWICRWMSLNCFDCYNTTLKQLVNWQLLQLHLVLYPLPSGWHVRILNPVNSVIKHSAQWRAW